MTERTTSAATAARLVKRHLRDFVTVTRGDVAYLCEINRRVIAGPMNLVDDRTRMICAVEAGDNIFGLRHIRAMREHNALDAEMQRRLGAPTAERQYALNQASEEFREEYARHFIRRAH